MKKYFYIYRTILTTNLFHQAKNIFNIKNIIVPTDLSELSASAFSYAKDLAERMDATIHLIHVLEKTPPFSAAGNQGNSKEKILHIIEEEAKAQLKEAAEDLREDFSLNVIEVLRNGVDYEEIIKYAKENNGDLIVIATHGRTGVLHTLMGSVAEKVIRYAKCPVLVITPDED